MPLYLATFLIILAQIMTAFAPLDAPVRRRELTAALHGLLLAAAILLVPPRLALPDALLITALTTLPLIYILSSITATVQYLIEILLWATFTAGEGVGIIWFYLLLSFAAPFIIKTIKHERYTLKGQLLAWFCAIYGILFLLATLRNIVIGPIATVVFSSYFSLLYIIDKEFYKDAKQIFRRPFDAARTLGTQALTLIFSFNFWAKRATFDWILLQEYIVTLLLIGLALNMFSYLKKEFVSLVYGGYFLFSIFCYLLTQATHPSIPLIVMVLESIYTILIGIAMIIRGKRRKNIVLQLAGGGSIALLILGQVFNIFIDINIFKQIFS